MPGCPPTPPPPPTHTDVYSYAPDEDDMVEDPGLAQHLAHWGIDIMQVSRRGGGRGYIIYSHD